MRDGAIDPKSFATPAGVVAVVQAAAQGLVQSHVEFDGGVMQLASSTFQHLTI